LPRPAQAAADATLAARSDPIPHERNIRLAASYDGLPDVPRFEPLLRRIELEKLQVIPTTASA
jgi:hypothetical protein